MYLEFFFFFCSKAYFKNYLVTKTTCMKLKKKKHLKVFFKEKIKKKKTCFYKLLRQKNKYILIKQHISLILSNTYIYFVIIPTFFKQFFFSVTTMPN